MAAEGVGPTTSIPLRARVGLNPFTKWIQDLLLLTLFIGLQTIRYADNVVTYVMRHGATSALFRGWTCLVLASYVGVLPPAVFQSMWFKQMDALIWLIRITEICWTIPRMVIHGTIWCLTTDLRMASVNEYKSIIWNLKMRSFKKKQKSVLSLSNFSDVKQCLCIVVGLYWVFNMPLAYAGITSCPMFTEKHGAGRWFHFYGAFRAYLIRQDIFIFDEKDPNNLIVQYPDAGETASIQALTDIKVPSRAVFTCVDMKAKSYLAEATAGYTAVCLTITNSTTYGMAVCAAQTLLMGQREATIALHRRKLDSNFRLMELYPKLISEYWVNIGESVTALNDFDSPVSDSDLRTRLLLVCDKHTWLHDIRAKSIFEPTFGLIPLQLVHCMKEFSVRIPEEGEPAEHTASSTIVRRDGQNRSKVVMVNCHRCAKAVDRYEIMQHIKSCKCAKPCATCGEPHLTEMHEDVLKSRQFSKQRNKTSNNHSKNQDGQYRSSNRTSPSTASAARREASGASTDFCSGPTPDYFYSCSARQESDPPPTVTSPHRLVAAFSSARVLRVIIGLMAIFILGISSKNPCKSIFSKQVCRWSSASAAAILLYTSTAEHGTHDTIDVMLNLNQKHISSISDQDISSMISEQQCSIFEFEQRQKVYFCRTI